MVELDLSQDRIGQSALADNRVVYRAADALAGDAHAARRVPLRIAVDEQRPLLRDRKARGEVYGGGRFTDSALLIGNGNDAAHDVNVIRETSTDTAGTPIARRLQARSG